jgi:hypothetical protein
VNATETPHRRCWYKSCEQTAAADANVCAEHAAAVAGAAQKPPSVSVQLVALALDEWDLIQSLDGRPYAIPRQGPPTAITLDGGRSSLRSALAELFYADTGKVPGRNALGEAIEVLRGRALHAEREAVELRHGRAHGYRLIDLGDDTGAAVALTGGIAVIAPTPGAVFRRTELTAPLPTPAAYCDNDATERIGRHRILEQLRLMLNVAEDAWPMLVGWMVAVTLGDVAVPAVFLNGEQGTGKTTVARRIVALTDPSTVPVRSAPKDVEAWVVAANGSRVVALDNLSTIPEWLSDALCRAVTGDGLVRRALYTNDELAVTTFRRAVILTSIDAGALRGDLGERLLPIELERIPADRRRSDAELAAAFTELYPTAFAVIVALAAQTADILDTDQLAVDQLPRMADYGHVLAALDHICGTRSLDTYRAAIANVFAELVAGDVVAEAIVAVARKRGVDGWSGTAGELLKAIQPWRPDDKRMAWPKTAKGLGGIVRRLAPSLRSVGVEVDWRKTETRRLVELRWHDELARSTPVRATDDPDALARLARSPSVAALEKVEGDPKRVHTDNVPDAPDVPAESSTSIDAPHDLDEEDPFA